ncbi:DELTA-sagatoxin-Srs1a-like isoform X2 [Gadus chalcogrammus]|nr:DELTA-sagatoxin-Srs1a-like isoform X2 [Gadus chalcogrammus]XP_056465352.1 DELTA-sagatoxin-Srs1a-like isoform X2 [Gadus chalcogrammus]
MTDRDSTAETTYNLQQVSNLFDRSCDVEVINSCDSIILSQPQVYLESGRTRVPLPLNIRSKSKGSAKFVKTSGTATGSVCTFTYNLLKEHKKSHKDPNNDQLKLAVMFSVPFDRVLYENLFAIGLFDSKTNCNYDFYKRMYYGSDPRFVRGKGGGSSLQYDGEYVVIQANMSSTGETLMRVEVIDQQKPDSVWF